MMYASSLTYNQSQVKPSQVPLPSALRGLAASGFWGGCHKRAFFDVRVFNPLAQSNNQPLATCYRKHKNLKK